MRVPPAASSPSAGRISPARTRSTSPATTEATGTSSAAAPGAAATRCATAGSRRLKASVTPALSWRAIISTKRASVRKKMNMVIESK